MRQRPENFNAAGEDPDETLVAPRFDADDARRAHPVVPLAAAPYPNAPRPRSARRPRRSWAPALLLVALFAAAALGGALAVKVMQSPRAEETQAAGQKQEQTQAAPVQTAEAAPQPSTPAAAEATREETRAARPATREGRTRRERAAVAVAAEPAREVADDDDDDREARGRASEKRRGREDDVEKEMRKALKRAKGKAPRLVDVLTSSH
jgi:hypothetical protein